MNCQICPQSKNCIYETEVLKGKSCPIYTTVYGKREENLNAHIPDKEDIVSYTLSITENDAIYLRFYLAHSIIMDKGVCFNPVVEEAHAGNIHSQRAVDARNKFIDLLSNLKNKKEDLWPRIENYRTKIK